MMACREQCIFDKLGKNAENVLGDYCMQENNEWLFDVMWDLSDKALAAGLPDVAGKLEEAMDTYLFEKEWGRKTTSLFTPSRSRRVSVARLEPAQVATKMLETIAARKNFEDLWSKPAATGAAQSSPRYIKVPTHRKRA